MSISYQFGDVDAHGAMIRSQAASLEAEHQAIVRDVLAAGDFWGGSGSVACQEFITQLGRNFQTIYEQANSHGQKVQTAGNNMASTDSAVGGAGPDTRTTYCGPHTQGVRATVISASSLDIRLSCSKTQLLLRKKLHEGTSSNIAVVAPLTTRPRLPEGRHVCGQCAGHRHPRAVPLTRNPIRGDTE